MLRKDILPYKIIILVLFTTIKSMSGSSQAVPGSGYIEVYKHGVLHRFVRSDAETNRFIQEKFPQWENETFDIFEMVKDQQGVAIDLGAWIGTTAIWLSKNFSHVVAVEADHVSLRDLTNNLEASESGNVSICTRPVAQKSEKVIFSSRLNTLNESVSYIKPYPDKPDDYSVRAITFKQLIHDYVYANPIIKDTKISFIKCDIEGGEEDILEDLLYFAYHNKVKVYLSFHLDWWKNKKIMDFQYLFNFFTSNCPQSDVCHYISNNRFASLLFEPREDAGVLIKKNISAVIIGYNQYTYIKSMVEQLEKYTSDIIVVDNNSSYEPLLDYYKNDFKYTLLQQKENRGHTVYAQDFMYNLVGDIFLLTDPDLEFNTQLPDDFIEHLLEISHYFKAVKVGFALDIHSDDIRTDTSYFGHSIKDWESAFWKKKISYPNDQTLQIYNAAVDTTFCLVNRTFLLPGQALENPGKSTALRIAGNYTCKHLPWYNDFKAKLQPDEYESYISNNKLSSWFQQNFDIKTTFAEAAAAKTKELQECLHTMWGIDPNTIHYLLKKFSHLLAHTSYHPIINEFINKSQALSLDFSNDKTTITTLSIKDGIVQTANQHQIVFENPCVRVLWRAIKPGERENVRLYTGKCIIVVIQPTTYEVRYINGTLETRYWSRGVYELSPECCSFSNVGDTAGESLCFEIKE